MPPNKLEKYDVHILKAENGVIIRAGCKVFVFNDVDEFIKELTAYLHNETTKLTDKFFNGPQEVPQPHLAEPCEDNTSAGY